ncbi:MAG: hypothetical protein KAH23_09445, partial [Kiritimatiellae bacterium]|nr:hypothetical protein [Kiritimatiellia bacterium]
TFFFATFFLATFFFAAFFLATMSITSSYSRSSTHELVGWYAEVSTPFAIACDGIASMIHRGDSSATNINTLRINNSRSEFLHTLHTRNKNVNI